MPAQELAPFGRRIGRENFQALAAEPIIAECEAGAFVHRRLVVDDRDLPAVPFLRRLFGGRVLDQLDDVVFSHAPCPGCAAASIGGDSPGATHGMTMRKRVPQPGRDSKFIRPPSCWVTRLNMMCKPSPVPPSPRRVVKNGSSARR